MPREGSQPHACGSAVLAAKRAFAGLLLIAARRRRCLSHQPLHMPHCKGILHNSTKDSAG